MKMLSGILVPFVFASVAFAETDENGLVPNQWLKFNGSVENIGSSPMELSSVGFAYAPSRVDLAGYKAMPFSNNGPGYGDGSWTVIESVRLSATAGDLSWAFGKKNSANGLALVSGGTDKVRLCTWTSSTTTTLLEVDVADAATKYHTYAVVVDRAGNAVTLFVDGVDKGSATIGGNPSDGAFQFGGVHSGEPSDKGVVKNGNCLHDEWRFYRQALTEDQIKVISDALPVWAPWMEISTETTFDNEAQPLSGSGDVLINAKVYFKYDLEHDMLKDFAGRIILGPEGKLYSQQGGGFDEVHAPLGQATIEFAGGELDGFVRGVHFIFEGAEPDISRRLAGSILMVLQEAIGNAVRHGKAERIEVKVVFRSECVIVRVRDNGLGFDSKALDQMAQLGVAGMKSRVQAHGGSFRIKSALGIGTVIKMRIPL